MDWIAFREPISDGCDKQQNEARNEGLRHRVRLQCPTCKQDYSLWLEAGKDYGPVVD